MGLALALIWFVSPSFVFWLMKYDASKNPLVKLSLIGLVLGLLLGVCCLLAVFSRSNYVFLAWYAIGLIGFHLNEFYCTFKYQPSNVSLKSFLIWGNKGNVHFWLMQLLTICEFVFKNKIFKFGGHIKDSNNFVDYNKQLFLVFMNGVWCFGGLLAIFGLIFRHLAMKTCGESFNHFIQVKHNQNHKLITHGVYNICRHPSYLGFWCFVVGIQLFLSNWINLLLNLIILAKFFSIRIQFEEWYLIHKLFGDDYLDYRKKVGICIPFVRIDEVLIKHEKTQ